MSRGAFIVGLCLSLALHVWLVMRSAPQLQPQAERNRAATQEVSVMQTELARQEPEPPPQPKPKEKTQPEKPEPEPEPKEPEKPEKKEPEKKPEPEPESKPEPEKKPEKKPEPEPEPEPQPEKAKPPQPNMEQVDEPDPVDDQIQGRGDLAGQPSDREAEPSPQLRINWGGRQQAQRVLEAAGMKLVVLNEGDRRPEITHQIEKGNGGWERGVYQRSGLTVYSNRLRIVDGVPAFDGVRRAAGIRPDERLAVLVPTQVESMLETAQLAAASSRNLAMRDIRYFAGRFQLDNGNLDFEVTRVHKRSATR